MSAPAPAPAAVAETHTSTVLFTGDRAYKIKKPVALGFLDFRTPEQRRAACLAEVALNRRFAPDVYLGVAEVRDEAGRACDWVVVMRRMPADRRLARLVRADPADPELAVALRELARLLAAHHAGARRSERIDRAVGAGALRARWVDTLTALTQFRGTVLPAATLDELGRRALAFVDGRGPLFAARVAAGKARDGHGDLLADDVFCLPDGPRALDCLEFDEDLRAVDGIDDAASLAMDLERLGAPTLAGHWMAAFLEFAGEGGCDALVHHYTAYRAGVRLKVACLRYAQGDAASAGTARDLAAVALRHLRLGAPRLVLVGGAPGTGKSTVAAGLADALGATLLRSDRLRKELAGLDPSSPTPDGRGEALYTPAAVHAVYAALLARAALLLGRGETVVLDATWGSEQERAAARRTGAAAHAEVAELRCAAPPRVAADRTRQRRGDPSDATPAVARALAAQFVAWPEATVLDTTAPLAEVAGRALAAVTAPADPPAPAAG
jgi:aminoglycoside phosphotransferase family enzyme/predicted kinase